MTDQPRTAQRTSLLVVFGMMFSTVGLMIGVADSYGVLSWIFLGLGVLLPLIAAVLAVGTDTPRGEETQSA
jgi:uncharacterized oligopeptide transporter (OPT) family protein